MRISDKLARARVSGTVKLAQMARGLKAAGRDVIELAEGEPDFDTPSHVIEAAYAAAKAGETRYTAVAGTDALRDAVAEKFSRGTTVGYRPEQTIVGTGAKQLIFNALLATLNPGDEVIVAAPYWVSYPDMIAIADGLPVVLFCSREAGFKLTAAQLEAAIRPQTRWVILNSPGNPSGAVYSESELALLADVLRRHPSVGVMCDDIYEEIVFDPTRFATMGQVAPDLLDRILTVNGVSKSYAMTGWRIGYAAGPEDLVAAMTKLQGQSTTNPSSIGQAAALAALRGPQDFLADWRAVYARRRDFVFNRLSAIPGLSLIQPEGAFYHFIDCSALIGQRTPDETVLESDGDVSGYLLNQAEVALVPGSEFGSPEYLRLCFAKSDEDLETACGRIANALGDLK